MGNTHSDHTAICFAASRLFPAIIIDTDIDIDTDTGTIINTQWFYQDHRIQHGHTNQHRMG